MKKITFLSLCALASVAYFAFTTKITAHPKPSLEGNICTTYSIVENDCVGSATNCLCEVVVTPSLLAQLNSAVANGNTAQFFSSQSNIQAFGLYNSQVQELTSTNTWVILSYNQSAGKYFYGVGTAANQSFNNVDFVIDAVPN